MHFFVRLGIAEENLTQIFLQKEWQQQFFLYFFHHNLVYLGQCWKRRSSMWVRMDMVLGNLHAKIGAHSSSSLVMIAAPTEICQKVAFFWQFFEDFSYFLLSQSTKLWNQVTKVQGNRFLSWFQWSWVYLKNLFNFLENCQNMIFNVFLLCYNSLKRGPSLMVFFCQLENS